MFGVPLSRLCTNNMLPPAISTILRTLFQRGLHTQGIFRRCASARALRELRDKVDTQGKLIRKIENSRTVALVYYYRYRYI